MDAAVTPYIKLYEQITPQLAGDQVPWLHTLQQQAVTQLQTEGFPNFRQEAWKHWPDKRFAHIKIESFLTDTKILQPFPTQFLNDYYCIKVTDGVFCPDKSSSGSLTDQIQLIPINTYVKTHPDKAQALIESIKLKDCFGALTTLFVNAGFVIDIPEQISLDKPILLHHSNTQNQNLGCPIIAVHLGKHSHATLINVFDTSNTNHCTNITTHIHAASSSYLKYYQIQNESHDATHINRTQVYLQANSQFHSFHAQIGAKLSRHEVYCYLQGAHASCKLDGLLIGGMHQHCDHFTEIKHEHPQTKSEQNYKGIVAKYGQAVFNGKIIITEGSWGCEAHQTNHNLLLDDNALMVSRPQLEIYNDDVQCTHGATTGFIDDDMIFYLLSRGIPHDTATALLSYGFAKSQIEAITCTELKNYLQQALLWTLPNSDKILEMIR